MSARNLPQVGDWVGGTSPEDERFIGFVESAGADGTVRLWVTQSDRETVVGTSVQTKLSKLKKLPEFVPSDKAQLQDLIDLSLATRDKAWFESLSSLMKGAVSGQAEWNEAPIRNEPNVSKIRNRIDTR